MAQIFLLPLSKNISFRSSAAAIAAALTTTAGAAWRYKSTTRCDSIPDPQQRQGGRNESNPDGSLEQSFRIESHLMDRIQQKQYLSEAKDNIPSTLRILAVDVPEMRTKAFTGKCTPSHDNVFFDDIARRKIVNVELENEGKKEKQRLEIVQKSLARSIVHCSSPTSTSHIHCSVTFFFHRHLPSSGSVQRPSPSFVHRHPPSPSQLCTSDKQFRLSMLRM